MELYSGSGVVDQFRNWWRTNERINCQKYDEQPTNAGVGCHVLKWICSRLGPITNTRRNDATSCYVYITWSSHKRWRHDATSVCMYIIWSNHKYTPIWRKFLVCHASNNLVQSQMADANSWCMYITWSMTNARRHDATSCCMYIILSNHKYTATWRNFLVYVYHET